MADTHPTPRKKAAQKPEKVASQAVSEPSKAEEAAPPKKKTGRPSIYSEEIVLDICVKLSLGQSLRSICQEEGMPCQSSVYQWLYTKPEFLEKYTRAREEQAETHADEIVDISDETPDIKPVIDRRTGEVVSMELSSAYIAWQKNRIESRKWNAAKQRPKKYGDRVQLAGDAESPLKITADVNLFDAILGNIEARRQVSNAD